MKFMPKIAWKYYFSRKFSAHRFEIVMMVFCSEFYKKEFGVRVQNSLVAPDGKNHAIYMDEREWPTAQRKVFKKACANWRIFQRYARMIKASQADFINRARRVSRMDLVRLSNQKLLSIFLPTAAAYQNFFDKAIWIPFITEPFLAEAAEKELKMAAKKTRAAGEYQKWFEIIFSPDEKNAILRERESMLKIAARAGGRVGAERALLNHYKKFNWIPCYDPVDSPWTLDYFQEELQQMSRDANAAKAELADIQKRFINRRRNFLVFLSDIKLTARQKDLFKMAHEMSFIKDERDDHRRLGSFYLQPMYGEIGRRFGLSLREAVNLLHDEITALLLGMADNLDMARIKERADGYILLKKFGSKIRAYSGDEIKKIYNQEISSLEKNETKEITGITGSAGKAAGSAQIILTKHDLRKVKRGDVLVAITTHPDFVPAMRLAAAIVTDEGGITCHAAIVARELGIPCVVGTKAATKVLNDGCMVEVDADRGIVKII